MTLYLVRHGKARKGGNDRRRPLTQRGINETKAVASLLKRVRLRSGAIWHSDRVRAIETALILAPSVPVKKDMIEQPNLGPDDSIRPILRRIKRARGDIMIVGHLPFLDKLIAKLVSPTASHEILKFSPSTIAAVIQEEGKWLVQWVIAPSLAAAITRTGSRGSR